MAAVSVTLFLPQSKILPSILGNSMGSAARMDSRDATSATGSFWPSFRTTRQRQSQHDDDDDADSVVGDKAFQVPPARIIKTATGVSVAFREVVKKATSQQAIPLLPCFHHEKSVPVGVAVGQGGVIAALSALLVGTR